MVTYGRTNSPAVSTSGSFRTFEKSAGKMFTCVANTIASGARVAARHRS